MQQSRRTTPYPHTWEIPLGAALAVTLVLVVAAHAARSLALALAGAGWAWTSQAQLFTSLPGILAGDSRAGLGPGPAASPALLYTCLVVVELVAALLIGWAVMAGMRQWGPARVRGMATRAEADTLLGVRRLRKVAPLVRPDLHGKEPRR
ncbi:hypothetical protein JNB_00875 [Janibacter sp. HTCC2649]|uniref:hypothetical protein n=1 Tax=Janibacter sp. HTCC2649 TaxID=313589 RepID=UPI000066ECE4|nr:hypothetical protein [Janibacter sp. HTCC2649]EAP98677.1 hypothetical protein JNB_00875 [Janibacter sp. HTCC2649]